VRRIHLEKGKGKREGGKGEDSNTECSGLATTLPKAGAE
jgi:hypothetical protein